MRLELKHLVLEITRKCNMQCAHCMRGKPQEVSMTCGTMQRLFCGISKIEKLTITGGEPSLAADEITNLLHYIKSNSIELGYFICPVNGKEHFPKFIKAIYDLYLYCLEKDKCVLSVSRDQFHQPADNKALKEFEKLPFYKPSKQKELPKYEILNEGRACENGIGHFSLPIREYVYNMRLDLPAPRVSDTIFVNAEGNVLLTADLSYSSQEKHSIGNINEHELDLILYRKLFPLSSNGADCIFRISVISDGNAQITDELSAERFFKSEAVAHGVFQTILENVSRGAFPYVIFNGGKYAAENMRVTVDPIDEHTSNPNFCDGVLIGVYLDGDSLAMLEIRLEQFLTEDNIYE